MISGNRVLPGILLLLALVAMASGAEEKTTPLFNGKDLGGWDGKPGWWRVEEGALTSESTPDKPCKSCNYLVWKDGQPGDFELTCEFKVSAEGNSGIQIRSATRPDWDTFGYQVDLSGDGSLIGFIYHHKRGLVAGRGEEVKITADGTRIATPHADPVELLRLHYKKGDWNQYRIICQGPSITVFLNGALMTRVVDLDPATSVEKGIIALQMHPGPPMKVQFRNLILKEAAPRTPP